jgi:hypothetical protein
VVVRRAILAAVVGGLAAALCVVAAYFLHPGLAYEMDRRLPAFITGMHGPEFDPQNNSFAWTSGHVTATITGLDRQTPWSCTIRFRGARAPGQPQPVLTVSVDGRAAAQVPGTNEFQDLGLLIPAADTAGATVEMDIAPTFMPGGADPRTLGVQIDRFLCRPSSPLVRPPANTLSYAALAAAIFAAGLALVGLSLSSAMFAAAAIGLGQAVMMAIGSGMYGGYAGVFPSLALWIVLPAVVLARTIERWRGQALTSSARFVFASTASVIFLQMAGLLHPAKPIVDAQFHAHRLDWVLAGRFFFEQPTADVTFPYAIGLYVFAAPWAWVTTNHVALVRAVTVGADVAAGALLYPGLVRAWGDRRAAAFASVLIQLAPLPLVTLANANLTNLFGQALALAVVAAAAAWRLDPSRPVTLLGFVVLTAWALCSHVSTISTLSATLGVLVVLYWWRGDVERRRAALAIVIGTTIALAAAWVLYYRHFMETYRLAFGRMFAHRTAEELAAAQVVVKGNMSAGARILDIGQQLTASYGWPLLVLAALGVWSLSRQWTRGRLESALLAWGAVWVGFSAATALAPVGDAYVRYSAEFLGRINLATLPLVAILAARGAALAWSTGAPASIRPVLQVVSILLVLWTLLVGLWTWLAWI